MIVGRHHPTPRHQVKVKVKVKVIVKVIVNVIVNVKAVCVCVAVSLLFNCPIFLVFVLSFVNPLFVNIF